MDTNIVSTYFWQDRPSKPLALLAYLHPITEPNPAWTAQRPLLRTLRLAVENHRA